MPGRGCEWILHCGIAIVAGSRPTTPAIQYRLIPMTNALAPIGEISPWSGCQTLAVRKRKPIRFVFVVFFFFFVPRVQGSKLVLGLGLALPSDRDLLEVWPIIEWQQIVIWSFILLLFFFVSGIGIFVWRAATGNVQCTEEQNRTELGIWQMHCTR